VSQPGLSVKFVVGALRGLVWTWKTGGRLDRLHIRVHLWWVSRWTRRLLVVTGARCPLKKLVVAAVELKATIGPHCSRGVQPGSVCAYVVHRKLTPGGPGPGLCRGRKCFQCQLLLWPDMYQINCSFMDSWQSL
jgi:hypothetical protein